MKTTTYKATKSKNDKPSVSSKSGTEKWGQISQGAGVTENTVVRDLKS